MTESMPVLTKLPKPDAVKIEQAIKLLIACLTVAHQSMN
jgi:hypothetical protein